MASSCLTCGKVFNKAATVEEHMRRKTHAAFKCPACPIHFLDKTSVAAHYGSTHRTSSGYPCLWCSELFPKWGPLSEHFCKNYKPRPPIPETGPHARQRESVTENVVDHPSTASPSIIRATVSSTPQCKTTKRPEFYCRACATVFESSAATAIHYRDTLNHTACTLCNISFDTAAKYENVHIISYHAVQHFTFDHIVQSAGAQCLPCAKYFTTVTDLEGHIDAVHGGGTICSGAYFPRYTGKAAAEVDDPTSENRSHDTSKLEVHPPCPEVNTHPPKLDDSPKDEAVSPTRDTQSATTANKRDPSPDRSPDLGPESPPSDGFETGDRSSDDKDEECPPGQEEVLSERKIGVLSSQGDLFDLERVVAPKSTAEVFPTNSERLSQEPASWPTGDPTSRAPVTESVAGEFATLLFTCGVCDKTAADPVATICGHFFCHQCIMTELSKTLCCPICCDVMLVRLRI